MTTLHVACGFSYSSIYKNMFSEMNNQGVSIKVYIPEHTTPDLKKIDPKDYVYPVYSNRVIKKWDKFIYFTKIIRMKNDVENNIKLSNIKLVHAHSLFSDGGVAYELFKKHDIPYIVAVRDTDVNQYYKKAKHLKLYASKILKNASAVIFLSEGYKNNVITNYVPKKFHLEILNKSHVIPNGISDYWLNNTFTNKVDTDITKDEINLIFVGQIIKRKNIESIVKASIELEHKMNKKVNLLLVGNETDPEYFEYLKKLGRFEHIAYCPPEELMNYYRSSDIFVMPSITETFGLVYAEAMSQGLPIIYTENQGFDNQFEDGVVGHSVNPIDVNDISNKIINILENHRTLSVNCIRKSTKFDWVKIVSNYQRLYENVVGNKI